jgi:hypothetical protein
MREIHTDEISENLSKVMGDRETEFLGYRFTLVAIHQKLSTSRISREVREVGYPHLLDIDEVAICMARTTGQAEDVATSLVAAKNAKETFFNFAASRLCVRQNRELLKLGFSKSHHYNPQNQWSIKALMERCS